MDKKYWDKAWSLVNGCTPVSEACEHCWLAAMHTRFQHEGRDGTPVAENGVFTGEVGIREDRLDIPLRTRKPTVFAIWSDLFHEKVPTRFIDKALEVMAACERHTLLALTKRPHLLEDKMYRVTMDNPCRELGAGDYLPNLWIGTTVENQRWADDRLPHLLSVPGKRFLSIEPMLGPIDLMQACDVAIGNDNPAVDRLGQWIHAVIVGGESGHGARPMNPDWVRSIRDQCQAAGVPFFFKQWGGRVKDRFLDGMEHNDLPWRASKKNEEALA